MLESVSHFREVEKFQLIQWNQKNKSIVELKEMYRNRLLELDDLHLKHCNRVSELENQRKDFEKEKREWERKKRTIENDSVNVNVNVSIPTMSPSPTSLEISNITTTNLEKEKKKKKNKQKPIPIPVQVPVPVQLKRKRLLKVHEDYDCINDLDVDLEIDEGELIYYIFSTAVIVFTVYYFMFDTSFIKFSF